MNKETILDILINGCEISQDKTGEVRYEYSQKQFDQVVKKLVNKTNDIHSVMHCEVCNDVHDVRVICKDCITNECNDRI